MTQQRSPTSAKRGAWSYKAGEKGRNRVRVFEWPGQGIWIDYHDDNNRRVRHSLKHNDRDLAKREADTVAARFGQLERRPPAATSLRVLFDMYEREVTPQKKSDSARGHDRRTLPLLLEVIGPNRRPDTLNVRDWQNYIRRRQSGDVRPPGGRDGPVRTRIIEQDLKLLLAVLNWAERARGDGSGYLLERNPLRGLKVPKEENPKRPILSPEQYQTVLETATAHSPTAERFVMIARYTGHRANAIRQLRWSDVDLEAGVVRWRGENDKIGYEHSNPMHPELVAFLKRDRAQTGAIGDAWLFPAADGGPMSRIAVVDLWRVIADRAGIPTGQRFGWHALRRAFAHALRSVQLRELKDLGGWKTERTVVSVYLQPDQGAQRKALEKIG